MTYNFKVRYQLNMPATDTGFDSVKVGVGTFWVVGSNFDQANSEALYICARMQKETGLEHRVREVTLEI